MYEVCKKCQGQKTFRGIGCIITKCNDCNGKGQVEIKLDTKDEETATQEAVAEEKPKRKERRKQSDSEAQA